MLLFGEDRKKAIAYYRHSAEDKQENSVEIQRESVVKKFGEGIDIVDSFSDEGFSGITINRPGFIQLLNKYIKNDSTFKIDYILVYDISRLGRFQNIPEALELLLSFQRKNISIGTVTRGLPNSQAGALDYLLVLLDFSQAGEYSRVLSEKVFAGCKKVSEQGFSAGGEPPFGYTRALLSEERKNIGTLKKGEHKAISNQRVTLVPARDMSTRTVKKIFHLFTELGEDVQDIADRLNMDNVYTSRGKEWNYRKIVNILTNETYIGTRIYNRRQSRLKGPSRQNPVDEWVKTGGAHQAIVSQNAYRLAQERLNNMGRFNYKSKSSHSFEVKAYFTKYLEELLIIFNDDQKYYLRQFLPVIYTNYVIGTTDKFVLIIPNKYINLSQAIAVVTNSNHTSIEQIYTINNLPSTARGVVIDAKADNCTILQSKEELTSVLIALSKEVLIKYAPWLE